MSADPPDKQGAERRSETRHFTCYPFHMQKGERGSTGAMEIAVIQDLSPSGALLFVVGDLAVGSRVKLHLDLSKPPVHVVEGRVIRSERRPPELSDVWPFAAAIQFDEAHADLLPEILELERKVHDAEG